MLRTVKGMKKPDIPKCPGVLIPSSRITFKIFTDSDLELYSRVMTTFLTYKYMTRKHINKKSVLF